MRVKIVINNWVEPDLVKFAPTESETRISLSCQREHCSFWPKLSSNADHEFVGCLQDWLPGGKGYWIQTLISWTYGSSTTKPFKYK